MNKRTILDFLNESVEKFGDRPYLYEARKGTEYSHLTYQQVREKSMQFAAGLIAMGIRAGDSVALISEGKNYWVIGELGILHAGAICVPLSVKLQTEQELSFRINHSECVAVLASDQQIAKLRSMKKAFDTVKHYILLDPEDSLEDDERLFETVLEEGRKLMATDPDALKERMDT